MKAPERASGSLPDNHTLWAPGLKRRPRDGGEARYWLPRPKDLKAGYRPRTVPLSTSLSEHELAAECRRLWQTLLAWRDSQGPQGQTQNSIGWLIGRYQTDEFSTYHALRERTKTSYDQFCQVIGRSIGERLIDRQITGEAIRRFHRKWGQPDEFGIPTTPARARHAIVMLRVLASYGVEIGVSGAIELRTLLSTMRFPTSAPREIAPTRTQVAAIAAAAIEAGYNSIALTTLAQFEFTERRTHIIGVWEGVGEDATWSYGWTWNNITADWHVKYEQTKVGKVKRDYDLKDTPMLLDLLLDLHLQTPEEKRGRHPVVICETTGQPWRDRHYAEIFRMIARKAGVPDDVRSMDMRAGGATEAASIPGMTPMDIQAAGGWKDPSMASRYTRDGSGRARNVVKARQKAQSKDVPHPTGE